MPKATSPFVPRFQVLADEIKERMIKGEFLNGQALPSERELGLAYDVSRQTIRNALKLILETGWLVSKAGKGNFVQYPPNSPQEHSAKEIRRRVPTYQIGLVCSSSLLLAEYGLSQRLVGLTSALSLAGYSVAVSVASKDEKNQFYPVYPKWLQEEAMDGYILTSVPFRVQEIFASQATVPVVNQGYVWKDVDIPSVTVDYRAIYRQLIIDLKEKNLLPVFNIVFDKGEPEPTFFFNEIIHGHKEGMALAGLKTEDARVIRHSLASGYEVTMSARRALKRHGCPRTIIVGSGKHLDDLISFLEGNGLRLPEDILIIVINHLQGHRPQLATFNFDLQAFARRSGEKLLEIIQTGKTFPKQEMTQAGVLVFPDAESLRCSRPSSGH